MYVCNFGESISSYTFLFLLYLLLTSLQSFHLQRLAREVQVYTCARSFSILIFISLHTYMYTESIPRHQTLISRFSSVLFVVAAIRLVVVVRAEVE